MNLDLDALDWGGNARYLDYWMLVLLLGVQSCSVTKKNQESMLGACESDDLSPEMVGCQRRACECMSSCTAGRSLLKTCIAAVLGCESPRFLGDARLLLQDTGREIAMCAKRTVGDHGRAKRTGRSGSENLRVSNAAAIAGCIVVEFTFEAREEVCSVLVDSMFEPLKGGSRRKPEPRCQDSAGAAT